jgi:L-ascorbate metabolism protein UlaG (beta-lactamase superfamily)
MGKSKAVPVQWLLLLLFALQMQAEQENARFWLEKELADGEAAIWYLHHAGWAVKTKNHLLIFDYYPETRLPGTQSLANGFIIPEEIKGQKVTVFVSHAHEDHFDPVIFTWREAIPDIHYVFGWAAEGGKSHTLLAEDHAGTSMDGMDIHTVHHRFDGIPEAAFLVKADGLVIYHSGDHACTAERLDKTFRDNIDYLSGLAPYVDIAFVSIFCRRDGSWVNGGDRYTLEKLRPRLFLPMHSGGHEKEYGQFAEDAAKLGIKTRIPAAGRRGEHFFYHRAG